MLNDGQWWLMENPIKMDDFEEPICYWLVVRNMFYFSMYWECHQPNWRTHIFQRGRYTTNQRVEILFSCLQCWCDPMNQNFSLNLMKSPPIHPFVHEIPMKSGAPWLSPQATTWRSWSCPALCHTSSRAKCPLAPWQVVTAGARSWLTPTWRPCHELGKMSET